jgi:hypothetical protein
MVGERIRNAIAVTQQINESAELSHRHLVLAPILTQQASFDELCPRHRRPVTQRLRSDDRLIRLASPDTAFEPVVECRLRHSKQPGCFCL